VRRVGADADARSLGQEDSFHGHAKEVAFELALQAVTRPGTRLAADLDAELLAEFGAQGRRHDVKRRLVQRGARESVDRAGVGMAVFLDAALQENRHRRLAAGGRTEQQEKTPTDVRARGRALEIIDYSRKRRIDPEQLALEKRARAAVGLGLAATEPAEHVPEVFVAGAGEYAR
jgi:hypothetical protein